jgi:hypothetical protein
MRRDEPATRWGLRLSTSRLRGDRSYPVRKRVVDGVHPPAAHPRALRRSSTRTGHPASARTASAWRGCRGEASCSPNRLVAHSLGKLVRPWLELARPERCTAPCAYRLRRSAPAAYAPTGERDAGVLCALPRCHRRRHTVLPRGASNRLIARRPRQPKPPIASLSDRSTTTSPGYRVSQSPERTCKREPT